MALVQMKPRHQHDCSACQYIASTFTDAGVRDWYVCTGHDASIVGRASSYGPDYWSAPISMVGTFADSPALRVETGDYALSPEYLVAAWMLDRARKTGLVA